ncbi:hypothetical protein ACQZ42_32390 [Rhizobium rhizogenes]
MIVEPNAALRARAAETDARTYASGDHPPVAFQADVAVIATKPQVVGDVVERYSALLADGGFFISVAAGIGIREDGIVLSACRHYPSAACRILLPPLPRA